jgi:2-phosphosulfolactate phosphatase
MKLSVYFTPLGITNQAVAGKPVIVLDVVRATSSIVAALANGARAVVPAATPDEALRVAKNLERDDVLLAGERGGHRIDGFDLGNSPIEMDAETVADKTLVMATTNGTGALVAAEPGRPVLVAAITNFSAVVARAKEELKESGELTVLCSGRERMFALEDAYVAGRIVKALLPDNKRKDVELNDAAIAALELVRRYGDRWKRAVIASAAARDLKKIGYRADVEAVTEVDAYDIVPEYAERLIKLPRLP